MTTIHDGEDEGDGEMTGQVTGGAAGAVGGGLIGAALGGPVGALIGAAVGAVAGAKTVDAISSNEDSGDYNPETGANTAAGAAVGGIGSGGTGALGGPLGTTARAASVGAAEQLTGGAANVENPITVEAPIEPDVDAGSAEMGGGMGSYSATGTQGDDWNR